MVVLDPAFDDVRLILFHVIASQQNVKNASSSAAFLQILINPYCFLYSSIHIKT